MMITSKQFLSLYILFLQNLLNPDQVTSHVKSILIEEWLSMIFPENNLATEECGGQYKSSCKKNAFCGRIIQICQLNKNEIVSLKHKYWGNPFLYVSFPCSFFTLAEIFIETGDTSMWFNQYQFITPVSH